MEQVWQFVESLLIVHNILQEFGDDPFTIEGFNGNEDEDVLVHGARGQNRLSEDALYQTGIVWRQSLVELFHES